MLNHPTLEKLQTLRLSGMLKALTEQINMADIDTLGFEERLGLLADREITEREDRRLKTRLRQARLKHNAYRINLKGESLRKRHAKLTPTTPSE